MSRDSLPWIPMACGGGSNTEGFSGALRPASKRHLVNVGGGQGLLDWRALECAWSLPCGPLCLWYQWGEENALSHSRWGGRKETNKEGKPTPLRRGLHVLGAVSADQKRPPL